MDNKRKITLALMGIFIWAIATLVFKFYGGLFFERSVNEYWINLVVTAVLYSGLFVGLMKLCKIESQYWLQGALCIALPGMLGEIPILVNFPDFMNSMHPETAGKYGAFLFAGYASLIGFAWLMSTKLNLSSSITTK